jgi:hypothetical protein
VGVSTIYYGARTFYICFRPSERKKSWKTHDFCPTIFGIMSPKGNHGFENPRAAHEFRRNHRQIHDHDFDFPIGTVFIAQQEPANPQRCDCLIPAGCYAPVSITSPSFYRMSSSGGAATQGVC